MVSHSVFAGGPVCTKLAMDAVPRLRGGKHVCSYLCCHSRALGPTPGLLIPLQRQSNIMFSILQRPNITVFIEMMQLCAY